RLKVDPDTLGVPEHLGHLFVQREHETRLPDTPAFGDVLERHHALAHTGDPGHDRRAAEEVPPIHDLVEPGNSRRCASARIEGGGPIAGRGSRRLDAAVDLDAPTGHDAEAVSARLVRMAARPDDLAGSTGCPLPVLIPSADHAISN